MPIWKTAVGAKGEDRMGEWKNTETLREGGKGSRMKESLEVEELPGEEIQKGNGRKKQASTLERGRKN